MTILLQASRYGKTEQFHLVILECLWRVVLPEPFCCSTSRPPHFTCCLPAFLCQQSLHTFHTLWVFPQSHFDCIYVTREVASVALIFFFNVFSASPCLLITFGKFIHVKEHICVGMCVVMSLFKATDSFKPKNLHFFLQVTYCMCC